MWGICISIVPSHWIHNVKLTSFGYGFVENSKDIVILMLCRTITYMKVEVTYVKY